jgi:peptidoglycan/LPS O-acetylase OafA/YrhL
MLAPSTNTAPIHELPAYAPALTGLRGVAAGWVLLFHLWQFMGTPRLALGPFDLTPLFARGHLGVDLFFVLSGYLIGGPWLIARLRGDVRPSLREFWLRRARRVLPAYWLQWLILAAVAWFGANAFPLDARGVLLDLSLTFNLFENTTALNAVWWSLPVEWDFYLFAPLLAAALASRGRWPWLLLGIVLASVAFRVLCWWAIWEYLADGVALYRWVIQLPGRLDQFALGMIVAWAFAMRRGGRATPLALFGITVTLALVWIGFHTGSAVDTALAPWLFFEFTLIGCGFAALTAAASMRHPAWLLGWLGHRAMGFVGTVSYSLYLWHYPLLHWLRGFADAHGWATSSWSFASAALAASLAAAWLSFRIAERPFLQRRAATGAASATPGSR